VEALLEHGRNMAEIGAQVLTTGTVEGELLGEVNAEIDANLAQGEQPKHYLPWISK
jgi:hypothetical protein